MPEQPVSRIIVSFRVGVALAAANVICAAVLAWAWIHVHVRNETVTVTGSATKRIQSDLIVWDCVIAAGNTDLRKGYQALKESVEATSKYLKGRGIPEAELTVGPVHTTTIYEKDAGGRPTNKIESYDLRQTLEVVSGNVNGVAKIARESTELIEQGVLFESQPPEYHFTKLADLKIEMLAAATRDATQRAAQITSNSGSKLGVLRSAHMGVMQITPAHSNEVSDSGMNDLSSLEKDVRAVVSADFALD